MSLRVWFKQRLWNTVLKKNVLYISNVRVSSLFRVNKANSLIRTNHSIYD